MYLFADLCVSSLEPKFNHIDWSELKGSDLGVSSLTGLSGAKIGRQLLLFVADSANNDVSSFYLQKQSDLLSAPVRGLGFSGQERIKDLVFRAKADKLYVATWNCKTHAVVVHTVEKVKTRSNGMAEPGTRKSHQIGKYSRANRITLRVLSDGAIFCGVWNTTKVHVCQSNTNGCSDAVLTLPGKHFGFDVKEFAGKKLLAAALADDGVSLYGLYTQNRSVVPLTRFQMPEACNPLFLAGDAQHALLVGMLASNGYVHAAMTFVITEAGHLIELHGCYHLKSMNIVSWCFVTEWGIAGTLVGWDSISGDLLTYDLY